MSHGRGISLIYENPNTLDARLKRLPQALPAASENFQPLTRNELTMAREKLAALAALMPVEAAVIARVIDNVWNQYLREQEQPYSTTTPTA